MNDRYMIIDTVMFPYAFTLSLPLPSPLPLPLVLPLPLPLPLPSRPPLPLPSPPTLTLTLTLTLGATLTLVLATPSHYKDEFSYLMSSSLQWTDEIDGGLSFNIDKIGDLSPSKGNFHDYNHKVLFMSIIKNRQGQYKYKMGFNFYRLTANTDYTSCLEILNTDYNLWNKPQISVDKGTSTGLSIGNISVKKLSHRYTDSKVKTKIMYYHRIIVNFRKLSSGGYRYFLHILVDIDKRGYGI